MPRPSLKLVHLPNFKGTASFLAHRIRRDDYFDKPELRYPIYSRLPAYWREQYEAKPPEVNRIPMQGSKRPQHDGLWTKDDNGNPIPAKNFRIKVRYTREVKAGLWGGEGYVEGFRHARGLKSKPVTERIWTPMKLRKSFWSEVLERNIETTVTPRTLTLIDEAYGFDNYILKTPENELCSTFGSKLKQEMLLRLLDKDSKMYLNDDGTREKVYNRYKKHIIKREDAEWVGLTLREAMQKQWDLEKEKGIHDSRPLLDIFTEELKRKLEAENVQKMLPENDSDDNNRTPDQSPPIFQA